MQAHANRGTAASDGASPELVRAAFRDLHAARLHGFALLVTLGDRARAARLADQALVAGASRAAELRHPERAAAWLRMRVLHDAGRLRRPGNERGAAERRLALEALGVGQAAFAGLTSLSVRERAILVADSVERLDARDVATIAGVDGKRLQRLVRRARLAYAAAAVDAQHDPLEDGPTVERVRLVAARALG